MISEIPDWAQDSIVGEPELQTEATLKTPVVAEPEDEPPLTIDGVQFPREASQRIRAMSADERSTWNADRLSARTDPIFLSGILGMDLQTDPHRVLFHNLLTLRGPEYPFAELSTFHKKMVLWPRGLAKTTSVRVLMVQLILNYPSIRLCFLTGGDLLAKRQLAALKACFEKPTKRFQELFPEFCLKSIFNKKTKAWQDINPVMGNSQQFSIPCRPTTVYAEPTFAISTPKSVKSGAHFDVMLCDDLVNDQNYQNAAALEKCYQQFIDTLPLLDPTGYLIVTGTVYSHADAYAKIQENAASIGDLSNWKFSVRDCWSRGKCRICGFSEVFHDKSINITEPPGIVAAGCTCTGFVPSDGIKACLFPRIKLADGRLFGHTVEFLNQQRAEMGETKFANQYENRVIAVGQQVFTEALIGAQTIFEPSQLPPYQLSETFIVGDLGYSIEEDRDETVLFVFKKYAGALWVFDCEAGHWGSNEFVERTLKLINKYHPKTVFYEKNQGWESMNNLLIARAPDFQVYKLPIQWISQSNQRDAKLTRISGIQTMLVGKRLWLYGRMPNYDKLVKQLVRFPRSGKHDDYSDALGMACEAPTGFQFETTLTQQNAAADRGPWWKHYFNSTEPEDQTYKDSGAGSGICC